MIKRVPKGSTCSECGAAVTSVEILPDAPGPLGDAWPNRPCGHTASVLIDNPPAAGETP